MSTINRSLPYHIKGLDELRGIACLAVLVSHSALLIPGFTVSLGAAGVDLFLVISGFLIAKILLRTRDREVGYYRNFYIRRLFRILPLAMALVALGIVASHLSGRHYTNVLIYYFTFTQNYIVSTTGIPPGSLEFVGPLVGCSPLWSLAVEEQFYLLLPHGVRRLPVQRLAAAAAAVVILGLALRYMVYEAPDAALYNNPHATQLRMHYLALGCLLAFPNGQRLLLPLFALWLALVGWFSPRLMLEPLGAAAMVYAVWRSADGRALLNLRPLAYPGTLCFGLYCLHWPILAVLRHDRVALDPWLEMGIFWAATFAVSIASYHLFEMPIQRQRTRFERHATT